MKFEHPTGLKQEFLKRLLKQIRYSKIKARDGIYHTLSMLYQNISIKRSQRDHEHVQLQIETRFTFYKVRSILYKHY